MTALTTTAVGLMNMKGRIVRHGMTLYLVAADGKETELDHGRLMSQPIIVYGVPLASKDGVKLYVSKMETQE